MNIKFLYNYIINRKEKSNHKGALLLWLTFMLTTAAIPSNAQEKLSQGNSIWIQNPTNKTIIKINLPASGLDPQKNTWLIFYALPNGNSIEWTEGKKISGNDDWHFDIQHIAAQTEFIRSVAIDRNVVVVYLANELKSWPAWKRSRSDGPAEIKRIVDSVTGIFRQYRPDIILDSHSGGGSFLFGYIDAADHIPDQVQRIGFIDSDYGYEDSMHTAKFIQWLKASRKHQLTVLAYNDSVVIFNAKPLVSPTGGTWYRSKLLQAKLASAFRFTTTADTALIRYSSLSNRVDIILKTNENGKIYHTEQVARNGFIHTVIGNTPYEKKAGYRYWGDWAYRDFIRP